MLAAVAAASPGTTGLPPANMANAPVSMVINQKKPAILALERGDASANRSVVTVVLIRCPLYARRSHPAGLRIRSAPDSGAAAPRRRAVPPPTPARSTDPAWSRISADRAPSEDRPGGYPAPGRRRP